MDTPFSDTPRSPWLVLVGLLLFIVGLDFPDVDLRVPFLLHRSLLTHGILMPLLLFLVIRSQNEQGIRLFVMGLSIASAVHLCFDLFPRAWRGLALIAVPFYGRTTPMFSWFWMGLSCVLCLYLAVLLVRLLWEILLCGMGAGATFALNCTGERHVILSLLVLAGAFVLACLLPSRASVLLRSLSAQSSRVNDVMAPEKSLFGRCSQREAIEDESGFR